jgi:formate dehydrogenase subunit delta
MSGEPSVIRMANDIARNQVHLPTADAAALIARHIRSFWDPRMRAELARLVAADPSLVSPVVVEALSDLARM